MKKGQDAIAELRALWAPRRPVDIHRRCVCGHWRGWHDSGGDGHCMGHNFETCKAKCEAFRPSGDNP